RNRSRSVDDAARRGRRRFHADSLTVKEVVVRTVLSAPKTANAKALIFVILILAMTAFAASIPSHAQTASWSATTKYPAGGTAEQQCITNEGSVYCLGGYQDEIYGARLLTDGVGSWTRTTSYPPALA